MQSAAKKTYISKKQMEKYSEQRQQQQQQSKTEFGPAPKQFKEEKPDMADVPRTKGYFEQLFSFSAKVPEPIKEAEELDRNDSCEEVDSDDMAGGLCDSDSDDGADRRAVFKAVRNEKRRGGGGAPDLPSSKYNQEFDTNVFEVKLDCLENKGEVATGDAHICTKCSGVFSSISKLTTDDQTQVWNCEFCNTKNEVMIDDEEIPKSTEVTYLIEAAPPKKEVSKNNELEEVKPPMPGQDATVIFAVDTSSSMNMRCGNMTRFQCVRTAVLDQIEQMSKGADQRKVGIVTFDSCVSVIGDGMAVAQVISGNQLMDFEYLKTNGKVQGYERLEKTLKENQRTLIEKINAIKVQGCTALGPAILTSVVMAAQGQQGSKVVICTDGLANTGLGSFHQSFTQEQMKQADGFYQSVGEIAQNAGVTIDIVSIEGDECNIDSLSKLAELTGGAVERVNPTNLKSDFASLMRLPVIATNVEAKVKIHKGLRFRNELDKDVSNDKTTLCRKFGNVTAESVFTFEYGLKLISELLKMEDVDMSEITNFPFQAQISYTALDGSKCLRVVTQQQEICHEREVVQKEANYEMLSYNCMQKATTNARAGDLKQAQAIMKGFKRGMKKNTQNNDQQEIYQQIENQIGSVYRKMGDQVRNIDDEDQQILMSSNQKAKQVVVSVPLPSQGIANSSMTITKKRKATKQSVVGLNQIRSQELDQQVLGSNQMMKKSKAPASKFAGKQNDALSTELYQMSNHTQSMKYRSSKKA